MLFYGFDISGGTSNDQEVIINSSTTQDQSTIQTRNVNFSGGDYSNGFGQLWLNPNGGAVLIGSGTAGTRLQDPGALGGNIPHSCVYTTTSCGGGVTTCSTSCAAGKKAMGGGCYVASGSMSYNRPISDLSGWNCQSPGATAIDAYAVCCSY